MIYSVEDNKNDYRAIVKSEISQFSISQITTKSDSIFEKLFSFLKNKQGHWMGFKPLRFEPQIELSKTNRAITWSYPKMTGEVLEFFTSSLKFNKKFGINEPADGILSPLNCFEGAIIPCVGIHTSGVRLGNGKGFYDKTFSNFGEINSKKILKIGVCFEVGFSENCPYEGHDLRLDMAITENAIRYLN